MSDSESSEEIDVKNEQKVEAKLRDLLEKAKQITPFYDDDTLMLIYKDCFNSDQVFINKLEIIAKNSKQAETNNDGDWIHSKRQSKEKTNKPESVEGKPKREKYHFLQDKAMIERAKRFDPERQKERLQRRQDQQKTRKERVQNYNKYAPEQTSPQKKAQFKEKEDKKDLQKSTPNQKKMKFKEKQDSKPVKNEPNQQKFVVQAKNTTKPEQKKVDQKKLEEKKVEEKKIEDKKSSKEITKQANKVEDKAVPAPVKDKGEQKKEKKNTFVQKPAQKVSDAKAVQGEKNIKKEIEPIQSQQISKSSLPQTKKTEKRSYKLKEESKPVQKQEKPVIAPKIEKKEEIKSVVQKGSQQKIESPTRPQKQMDEAVKKQFQASCRQNTFILKFIPPSQKLQKVSYIRDPNGTYRDVKVRQVLPRN